MQVPASNGVQSLWPLVRDQQKVNNQWFQDPGLVPPVSATPPEDVPMAPTAPGTTPPGLSDSTIGRITSAVIQAVMESLQMPKHNPMPLPLKSNTREVPLQGISVADAQGQGQ